jgi:hypothetical protein
MLLQKKILGYIDFKSTNDLMSGRHLSKNLEKFCLLILCASNMLQSTDVG